MHKSTFDNLRSILSILLLVVVSVVGLFIWQSHVGLSLLDEGFLWYGAQRVMLGEVPMRDFMAYDIGRYYWSAALMSLWGGKGIVALRFAIAVLQAAALFIGLTVLTRYSAKQHFLFWVVVLVSLLTWMSPQYRVFDISPPIILVGSLAFLVEKPSARRYFLTGLVVGLVSIFGRNHGLYGVLGSLSVLAYSSIKQGGGLRLREAFSAWMSGVMVGYLPVLVFLVVVPGFAQAFWESILLLFEIKATNIPLPVPWPWLAPFGQLPILHLLRGMMMGVFFIAIVAFGVMGIAWAIRKKLQGKHLSPTLIAAISLALPYAHYAYSRPDIEHLAPGMIPFIMGVLVLIGSQSVKIKWVSAVLLCGASWWAMAPTYSGWTCYINPQCVEIKVSGDVLIIDRETANSLTLLNKLAEQLSPDGQTFIATPFWPGAYAALGRKSPVWEIYALFPRSNAFQQAEIERIKTANPGFVVVLDFTVGGDEGTRFSFTHPIIANYIKDNFVPVSGYSSNPRFHTYRSKQSGK